MILLYYNSKIPASVFTIELTCANFIIPVIVLFTLIFHSFRFSGSPLRSAIYSLKLKLLHIAVMIWTIARILRAVGGIYESKMFYGMMLGL